MKYLFNVVLRTVQFELNAKETSKSLVAGLTAKGSVEIVEEM